MTKEVVEEQAKKAKEEEADMIGPALPAHMKPVQETGGQPHHDGKLDKQ